MSDKRLRQILSRFENCLTRLKHQSSYRSSMYGSQPFNKMASTRTATYGSDANGNTTTKTEGSNFWHFGWDYDNRLTQASTRKQSVRYKYDAIGRRVRRHIAGSRENTKFTYDGDDVLMNDDSGTLTKYLNGSGIDNKLRSQTGSTASYFLSDHLGSTNGLANASGALTASRTYDSFGNPTNMAFPTRYQFTGREYDSFTGLQFSRARYYDPSLGRFISEDPIGFAGKDMNSFGYVRNQPLVFRDSRGLFPDGDVLNPNILRDFSTLLQGAGTSAGAAIVSVGGTVASSPTAVVFGGLTVGAAIGLPIGIYTANHPANPFVNGPLNPFPIWDKIWEPNPYPGTPPIIPRTSPGSACQPRPKAIPWTTWPPDIPWTGWPPDIFPVPIGPVPPISPEKREECAEKCSAFLGTDLDGSAYRKCYRECIGTLPLN